MIEIVTYALELFLDSAGDAAVRELWNRLEDAGLPSLATRSHGRHRPHVTLAVAEQFEVDDRARSLLEQIPGTELTMPVLGAFPGEAAVLFLGVTSNAALLNAHAALHAAIASGSAGLWDHYRPGNWVPHCTLAMDLNGPTLMKAIKSLYPHSAITARATQLHMVELETGQANPLF
ncbi:2'-5' RNA ligase family protein [Nocardia yamanashiensis]|uniref:2'-5' RNA ligase family protein n=1 Tax=Nocardia yamanashiensis TaxID=209247 RepID=UPI001E62FC5D|nr:2'-5' RNA ligase family protein [Nocardia yamanashiensis]UGT43169.1 2'-5' RNA ligase family protein [Nocardia yamanashiensis]